jgi:hypothetical protein
MESISRPHACILDVAMERGVEAALPGQALALMDGKHHVLLCRSKFGMTVCARYGLPPVIFIQEGLCSPFAGRRFAYLHNPQRPRRQRQDLNRHWES